MAARGASSAAGLAFVEVALTLVVAVAASLMVRSYRAAERTALGFEPDGLVSFRLTLPSTRYYFVEKIGAFYHRALGRLATVPGIDGIAAATRSAARLSVGRPALLRRVDRRTSVGRRADADSGISRRFARLPWRRRHAVDPFAAGIHGRRHRGPSRSSRRQRDHGGPVLARRRRGRPDVPAWSEVWPRKPECASARRGRPRCRRRPGFESRCACSMLRCGPRCFCRSRSAPRRGGNDRVCCQDERRSGDCREDAAGKPWRTVDPDMPIFEVDTMENIVADAFGPKRLTLVLLLFFATVAAALAAIGLYGIVSFAVEQRARELSVRIAIGAAPRAIVMLVLRDAAVVACAGIGAGAAAAVAVTRLMSSELTGVSATDPATYAAAATFPAGYDGGIGGYSRRAREPRRPARGAPRRLTSDRAGGAQRRPALRVDPDDPEQLVSVCAQARPAQHVRRACRRRRGRRHARIGAAQAFKPVRRGSRPDDRRDGFSRECAGIAASVLCVDQIGTADPIAECAPELGLQSADGKPTAVRGFVQSVAGARQIARCRKQRPRRGGAQKRDVHRRALAGARPLEQRGEDGDCRLHR